MTARSSSQGVGTDPKTDSPVLKVSSGGNVPYVKFADDARRASATGWSLSATRSASAEQ